MVTQEQLLANLGEVAALAEQDEASDQSCEVESVNQSMGRSEPSLERDERDYAAFLLLRGMEPASVASILRRDRKIRRYLERVRALVESRTEDDYNNRLHLLLGDLQRDFTELNFQPDDYGLGNS